MSTVVNSGNFQIVSYSENELNKKTEEKENKTDFLNTFFKTEEKEEKEEDKSNNGKFDLDECCKNFYKGIFSPISAVIEHPVITIGVTAGTIGLCTAIPVMAPVLGAGFGLLSAYQLGKGIVNIVQNYQNGNYDEAEKSFYDTGEGSIGIALGALGIKQGAKIAQEAKMMNKLDINSLNPVEKANADKNVKNMSKIEALKETGTLFTSKEGIKSFVSQFKPSNIKQRAVEAYNHLFKKEDTLNVKQKKIPFKMTQEGKRRGEMSIEDIQKEVNSLYKEACDEYNIPKELRPEIKVYSDNKNATTGGGYDSSEHAIKINEVSYKEGYFDLPDIIKHETTHANEAILRQRLPMEEKQKIAVEYLLDKIQNGDKEKVLTGEVNLFTGLVKADTPKMSNKMKADFAKLAQEKLYQLTEYKNEDFISMVKPVIADNPEFVNGYKNIDESVSALANYAKNHNFRYKIAMNNASGFNTSKIDLNLLKELSPEEKVRAIKSFKESIDCIEGNASLNSGVFGLGGDFDQYQFTSEEVLAQQKGNSFEISKLENQLKNLRTDKNYNLAEEARLLDRIKKCKLTIEYKTKGKEMYRLQTESHNNPDNIELAEKVNKLQNELYNIGKQIEELNGELSLYEQANMLVEGINRDKVFQNYAREYSTYIEKEQKAPLGASVEIPKTTTVASNIIAENIAGNE